MDYYGNHWSEFSFKVNRGHVGISLTSLLNDELLKCIIKFIRRQSLASCIEWDFILKTPSFGKKDKAVSKIGPVDSVMNIVYVFLS